MTFVAAAIAGSAAVGAGASIYGANKAADAQAGAAGAANALSQKQFDMTRRDLEPWRNTGSRALSRLDRAAAGDLSDFTKSPGYQFRLDEGNKAINNSFAARGGSLSGAAIKAGINYNQGAASNEFGNWWARQLNLSEGGRGANGVVSNAGAQNAQNQSTNLMNAGNARATGYINNANTIGNLANNASTAYGYWKGNQPPPPPAGGGYQPGTVNMAPVKNALNSMPNLLTP